MTIRYGVALVTAVALLLTVRVLVELWPMAQLTPPAQTTVASRTEARAAWGRVLATAVDGQGRVDFAALSQDPADLETWVRYVGRNAEDDLAYQIDAYNGLAMYAALRSGLQPRQTIRYFFLLKMEYGDTPLTLYRFEKKIRERGDPRVHFALNCMSAGCPRLPQVSWQSERIDEQLDAAAIEFLNSREYVRVDHERRAVHLSEIFDFFTDDFLEVAPSLLAYVNTYRLEAVPEDYEVVFIPYDWSLNDVSTTRVSRTAFPARS